MATSVGTLTDTRLTGDRPLARLIRSAEAVLATAAAAVLALLLALVLVAVARRYLLGGGLAWSTELAVWLHAGLIALGAPLAAAGALAMRCEVLTGRLAGRARAAAGAAADGVVVHAGLVLLSGGWAAAGLVGGQSSILGAPEWWRHGAFAAAGGLTALLALLRAVEARGLPAAAAALALGAGGWALSHAGIVWEVTLPSLAAVGLALAALLIGAPFPHALLAAASLSHPLGGLLPEPAIAQNAVAGVSGFLLLAIPLFLLAGGLLTVGDLGSRLVRLAAALVGHRRGGLAQAVLLTSVLFSGASGSSIANAAFSAKLMGPTLVARGYDPPRVAATVAASSLLDNLIPPSIAFLILAAATDLSVGGLMTGGLAAGLLLAAVLAAVIHLTSAPGRAGAPADRAERLAALKGAVPVVGLGLVVLLGIRLGIVTTTEASALAAAYALGATVLLSRPAPAELAGAFRRAAVETASIGLLIAASAPLTFLLAVDQVGVALAGWVAAVASDPVAVMLLLNLLLLLAGTVLDVGPGILLLAPLLTPVAEGAGIDPLLFGVVLVANLMIGALTPPVGVLVFVAAGVMGLRPDDVFRAQRPLLAALVAALLAGAAAVAVLG